MEKGRRFLFMLSCFLEIAFFCSALATPPVNGMAIVHIGVILDFESTVGMVANTSISMALDDFNAIYGRRIHLVLHRRNSLGTIFGSAAAAIHLMEKIKVQAIIGPQTSEQAEFLAPMGGEAHIPIISFSAVSSLISPANVPYFVRIAQNDSSQARAIAAIVQAYRWREVVLVHEDGYDGIGLIAYLTDALQEIGAQVGHVYLVSHPMNEAKIHDLPRDLAALRTRVFIVHLSFTATRRLFLLAHKAGMMEDGYVWIVTSGFTNLLGHVHSSVFRSMQGVLGVKTHVPESGLLEKFTIRWEPRFLKDHPEMEISGLNVYALWAYDTTWAVAMAAERTEFQLNKRSIGNQTVLQEYLLQSILQTRFTGLSGEIQLVDGQLESSDFEIINVVGNGGRVIGYWTPKIGLSQSLSSKNYSAKMEDLAVVNWPGGSVTVPNGYNMLGRKLRIGVPVKSGFREFVKVERDSEKNTTIATGFCIEVFNAVMERLPYQVSYEFFPYENGNENSSEYYDELIYRVYLKEFDAVVGDTTITANRSNYVDFTQLYVEPGVIMIVGIQDDGVIEHLWLFLKLKKMEMTLIVFLLNGILVWIFHPKIYRRFQDGNSGVDFLGSSVSASFLAQGVTLESIFLRLMVTLCTLIVLRTTYTFISLMTVQMPKPVVADIDLLIEKGDYVGYQSGSFVLELLKEMGFQESKLKPYATRDQYAKALSQGSGNNGVSAIVDEIPYTEVFLKKYCNQYTLAGDAYRTGGFGFVFPRGSDMVPDVSKAVLELTQGETMSQVEKKWFGRLTCPGQHENHAIFGKRLTLESFWSVSSIVASAALALLAFFLIRAAHRTLCLPRHERNEKWEEMITIETDVMKHVLSWSIGPASSMEHRYSQVGKTMAIQHVESDADHEEEPLQFDLDTIIAATDNFSETIKLREGGFGAVYKGCVSCSGEEIDRNSLSRMSGQGLQEFKNNVALNIAELQYRILDRLLGCCVEREEKFVIYEDVALSSPDKLLFDRNELHWECREIIHLHQGSLRTSVRQNLKAIFEMEMSQRISGFGMARIYVEDQTQGNTSRIARTHGYMAPEYATNRQFSARSDVVRFSVLRPLEIVFDRNSDFNWSDRAMDLLGNEWKFWNGTILELIDPTTSECCWNEVMRHIHIPARAFVAWPARHPTACGTWILRRLERDEKWEMFMIETSVMKNDLRWTTSPTSFKDHRCSWVGKTMAIQHVESDADHKDQSLQFDWCAIRAATDEFPKGNKHGEGGFGAFNKGGPSDEQEMAVKRFSHNSGQGLQEFKNKGVSSAVLQYENHLRLLYCCVIQEKMLRIHKDVVSSGLEQLLFDGNEKADLDWERLHQIEIEATPGLLHLHEGPLRWWIRQNLNVSRIFLELEMIKYFDVHILDLCNRLGYLTFPIPDIKIRMGETHRCMPPEYAKNWKFFGTSDVLSSAVEIVFGQKNSDFYQSDCPKDLLSYTWKLWNEGTILELINRTISESCSNSKVMICIHIVVSAVLTLLAFFLIRDGRGVGAVYKDRPSDGLEIAVKGLFRNSEKGLQEFKDKVALIAELQYNLFKTLGCCFKGKLLIYKYNSYLDKFLFDPYTKAYLDWERRYKIFIGLYQDLVHVHEDSQPWIIHWHLKPSNIWLHVDWSLKLSDFGLARIYVGNQTQGNTSRIAGTHGYMAPEYATNGQFSFRSNVFSFGVSLLEIVFGQKNSDFYWSDRTMDLPSYAWRHWKDGTIIELIDPTISKSCSNSEVMRYIHIALLCVQEDVVHRPTLLSIVLMLNGFYVTLTAPSQPASSIASKMAADMPTMDSDMQTSELNKSLGMASLWSVNEASITEVDLR